MPLSCVRLEKACSMDADRFDTLSRSLTEFRSRRTTLASLLGGALGLVGLAGAEAKKKCQPCKKRKNGKCKGKKPDGTACPGGACLGGSCVAAAATGGNGCPDGQRPCGTACILAGQCCTDTDCPTGATCCGRLCVETTSDPRHCGNCTTTCSAGTTCSGGRCCTARADDCTPADVCCGTDVCSTGLVSNTCTACSRSGCVHSPCCPGLFCVDDGFTETCVTCKPMGKTCQNSNECCPGLSCQSGMCRELQPI